MFIVSLTYKKELSEVEKYFDAHMAYVKKYYAQGNFMVSGRKVPRTGGVILVKASTREEVDQIVKEDPFYSADVADFDVIEFIPSTTAKGLETLLEKQ